MRDDDPVIEEMADLAREIGGLLRGHEPEVQGGALADLLAIHLCGWPRPARELVLRQIIGTVRELVPVNEKIIYGGKGHPQDREMTKQ